MKSTVKKLLAMLLLMTMVCSNFQMSTLYAMEKTTNHAETVQTDGMNEVADAADEEQNAYVAEHRLNYIYVERPYVEAPDTQNIMISWGDGTEAIHDMSITVQKEDGTVEEWLCENQSEEIYLFSKEYTDTNEESTYQVMDIQFVENGAAKRFSLQDLDVEAEFGVNKIYDGLEELKPIDTEDTSELETSVVTIDENGDVHTQTSIAQAMNAVAEENAAVKGTKTTEKAGDVVVALDPGHDNKHGGTSRTNSSGKVIATEQELVLKIANYAKQELETYQGVKVYMTRTSNTCPYPSSKTSGADIEQRVKAAKNAGAKIFVSFHLNSALSSAANGAEIIIPNKNWKPQLSTDGKALAEKIIDELAAVGVNKRPTPIYSKDTTINEKYPDGSLSDYWTVQICSKEAGIPGLIIEHAFLSNSNDYNNFLSSDAGLKKLGVADATGIAKYLELQKKDNQNNGNNGWVTEGGYKYYYVNGQKVTGANKIGNAYYYFSPNDGRMHTGFRKDGSDTYYYAEDGKLVLGAVKIGNAYYYFSPYDGKMHTGLRKDGNDTYYYAADGKLVLGAVKIGNAYYYFSEYDGKMHTGFRKDGSDTYYYTEDGKLVLGAVKIGNAYYYFSPYNGKMHTGFRKDGNDTYYYTADGKLVFGAVKIGNAYYYFSEYNGKMHTGFRNDGKDKYYYQPDGQLVFGWQVIDGKQYYFDKSNGILVHEVKELYDIMGTSQVTVEKMVAYFNSQNKPYPAEALEKGGAPTIEAFCQILYEEAKAEGVKAEVVFCQAMLETGWLQFGGDVKIEQFNFAGLGAAGGGAAGADFSSYGMDGVRIGLRAQVQHLKCYASKQPLVNECVDPRWGNWLREKAPYVEWLGSQENPNGAGWATGARYGFNIRTRIELLKTY